MALSAHELTLLGKKAAADYLDGRRSLNESISQIKEAHELTDDETRRVVERANTAVLLARFHAGGDDRSTVFDVADPYVILGTDKEASADDDDPTLPRLKSLPGYRAPAPGRFEIEKLAGENVPTMDELMGAIARQVVAEHGELEKEADDDEPEIPLHTLREAVEELEGAAALASFRRAEAEERFHKEAESVLREHTVSEVIEALLPFTKSAGHLDRLAPVVERLKQRSPLLIKAGALRPTPPDVNPEHPMVKAFVKLGELLEDEGHQLKAASYARTVLNNRLRMLANTMRRRREADG